MSIVFACSASHAPGITAWTEAAPAAAKERIWGSYKELAGSLASSGADVAVVFASEHFANFFLDNMPAFCVGKGAWHSGPVEPWLRVPRRRAPGDPEFADTLLRGCYEAGFELAYSEELDLDHGTMLPMHFLLPNGEIPFVPVIINTLVTPMPTAARCWALGEAIGRIAQASPRKVALIGTGGLSHWPGEREHGRINEAFDRDFLKRIIEGNGAALSGLSHAEIAESGTGGHEIRAWIIVAGAMSAIKGWRAELLAYEPVPAWGTGCGLVEYRPAA